MWIRGVTCCSPTARWTCWITPPAALPSAARWASTPPARTDPGMATPASGPGTWFYRMRSWIESKGAGRSSDYEGAGLDPPRDEQGKGLESESDGRLQGICTEAIGHAGMHPPDLGPDRSEEHTSELQSLRHLVCRLLLEKKKKQHT